MDIFNQSDFFDYLHRTKYRNSDDTKEQHATKLANSLASNNTHFDVLRELFLTDQFLPAGRVQAALGSNRESSPFNCAVSGTIPDSMEGIMDRLKEGALTLRLGTGIGYDFSTLRPKGSAISTLKSEASGPVSFMRMFDGMAKTIHMSHRRGAQMGILNVHHPDIMDFIGAKMKHGFSTFNFSVAITDEFMRAVAENRDYELRFPVNPNSGERSNKVSAREVWERILQCAYDSAEPGIVFIDRINNENNLYYCEDIRATNPCAEQPLPPYGMCLLGSFNLVKYLRQASSANAPYMFDYGRFTIDIHNIVEAYDNIYAKALYALPQHREEALNKRRMGLGMTGIANALEVMGYSYGNDGFIRELTNIAKTLFNEAYSASARLAAQRGAFPLFDKKAFQQSITYQRLNSATQALIDKYGLRNSHLISYAPCGTISLCAGNVSSGVEPVFYHSAMRDVLLNDSEKPINIRVEDYAYREYGIKGKTLEECTVEDHLRVALTLQKYCDSSISKTVNVPEHITFSDYRTIYERAYYTGLKGITVYRKNDIRGPVIKSGDCENGVCEIK